MTITTASSLATDYDLVVVGGGATGLSLVLGLIPEIKAQHLQRILLVEKAPQPQHLAGRSIALNQNTLQYYANIPLELPQSQVSNCSVLSYIADLFEPLKRIIVATDTHPQELVLDAHHHHLDQFGGVVDLVDLQLRLQELLQVVSYELQQQGYPVQIDIVTNTSVTSCDLAVTDQGQVYRNLTLTSPDVAYDIKVTASCVAIANGAKFIAGIHEAAEVITVAHEQTGIIADVQYNRPVPYTALEFFSQHGPVALLPTGEQSACVVWCTNDVTQAQALTANQQYFADQLNSILATISNENFQALQYQQLSVTMPALKASASKHQHPVVAVNVPYPQAVQVQAISATNGFKLNATRLAKVAEPGVVYLGNAAHTLHPVSGQGFNLAILSIEYFIKAIKATINSHSSVTHKQHESEPHTSIFSQEAVAIGDYYNQHYVPVVDSVFKRTNIFAREFTSQARFPAWLTNFGLYHLIAYPLLQTLIVTPSVGNVKPQEFATLYNLLQVRT